MTTESKDPDNPLGIPEWITIILERKLQEQTWFRRYSNTITTAFTGLMTLAWWLTSTRIDLPEWSVYAIGALLWLGQIVGVKRTKNGVTPSVIDAVTRDLGTVPSGRHHRGE